MKYSNFVRQFSELPSWYNSPLDRNCSLHIRSKLHRIHAEAWYCWNRTSHRTRCILPHLRFSMDQYLSHVTCCTFPGVSLQSGMVSIAPCVRPEPQFLKVFEWQQNIHRCHLSIIQILSLPNLLSQLYPLNRHITKRSFQVLESLDIGMTDEFVV